MIGSSGKDILTPEQVSAYLPKISANIEDVKGRIYDVIYKHYDELLVSFEFSEGLDVEVNDVQKRLADMRAKLDNVEAELAISQAEKERTLEHVGRTEKIASALGHLCLIHERLISLDSPTSSTSSAVDRAKMITEVSASLSTFEFDPTSQESDKRILKALTSEFVRCKSNFRTEIEHNWRKAVVWERNYNMNYNPNNNTNVSAYAQDDNYSGNICSLVVRLSPGMLSLADIARALTLTGVFHGKLENFARKLMQNIVAVCVRSDEMTPTVACVSSLVTTLKLQKVGSADKEVTHTIETTPVDRTLRIYDKLRTVFKFVGDVMFHDEGHITNTHTNPDANVDPHADRSPICSSADQNDDVQKYKSKHTTPAPSQNQFMCALGRVIWEPLTAMIIDEVLVNAIPIHAPQSDETDHTYQKVIESTRAFESDMISCGIAQGNVSELSELSRYAENVSVHFSNRIREDMLMRARDIMRDFGETVRVSEPSTSSSTDEKDQPLALSEELRHLSFAMPTMTITASAERLVNLAYSALEEACDEEQSVAVQRFFTTRDMFELFRAVIPVVRNDAIKEDRAAAFLVYTDCLYISHKLTTLGVDFKGKIPLADSCVCTFVDLVIPIREMGDEYYLAAMRAFESALHNDVQIAGGIGNTDQAHHFEVVEKAIQSALERLSSLCSKMELLPKEVAKKSLGYLLDIVCDGLTSQVFSLTDISEEETHQLNYLLSLVIYKANKLFSVLVDPKTKPSVDVSTFSSEFARYCQLTEILEMRMKVIVQRYRDGQLYFSADEMKTLIKALFQDTSIRVQQLARLQ
eukprot:CFRG6212T1